MPAESGIPHVSGVPKSVTKWPGLVSASNKHETLRFQLWMVPVAQFDLFKRLFGGAAALNAAKNCASTPRKARAC